jgi:hypothetical protein
VDGGRSLGRQFGWLWAAYSVSTFGTWFAFDAFPLVAIFVLHVGSAEVSVLKAAGLAVGAVLAVPLGPWVEFRSKRPVMVAMDLLRFAAVISVPLAFAVGWLTFAQLLVASVVVAAADITFQAAAGANLKALVPSGDLLVANGRFESTNWTASMVGPPLGGAAMVLLGPMAALITDAVSYLLSALGIRAIGGREQRPVRPEAARLRATDLLDGWRFILTHPTLRLLFFNTVLVSSLILATGPLLIVLLLDSLGFTPWEYGLAFGVSCVGGLIGSRLSGPLVARFGRHRILLVAGTLRACWSVGLAFIGPGAAGLVLLIAVEFGLITCMGVFNPVFATHRLELVPNDRVVRTLTAWSVSTKATSAIMSALWGLLATLSSARTAIEVAGVLILATPFLLPRHEQAQRREPERV